MTIGLIIAIALVIIGLVADLVLYLRKGTTETISHGMYVLGTAHPWIRAAWIVGAAFLYWHFWG